MKQWFSDIGQQTWQCSDPHSDGLSLLPRENFQVATQRWEIRIEPSGFL
jgi:hypothetical protein